VLISGKMYVSIFLFFLRIYLIIIANPVSIRKYKAKAAICLRTIDVMK
jgi:hypothetical protein